MKGGPRPGVRGKCSTREGRARHKKKRHKSQGERQMSPECKAQPAREGNKKIHRPGGNDRRSTNLEGNSRITPLQ